MNAFLKAAAASAAVVVVGIAGFRLLSGTPATGGPPPPSPTFAPSPESSAARTPRPAATPACDLDSTGCAGWILPGDHRSTAFRPSVSFTVTDDDWVNTLDVPGAHVLHSTMGYLLTWSSPEIVERTAACETTPAEGRGNDPQDWIDFVTTHPGLTATNVHRVEINARPGFSVDLVSRTDWSPACAEDDFLPNLAQFIYSPEPGLGVYGVSSNIPIRLVILDVNEQTVMIGYYMDLPLFETNVGRAQAVIDTMRFCWTPIGGGCADDPIAPTIQCEDGLPGCAGLLEAGVNLSAHVQPRLKFTTPQGWTNSVDLPSIYKLDPPDPADPYVLIWTNVDIIEQSADCEPIPRAAAGATVADWVEFLTSHPGLVASEPAAIALGSARGQTIDVTVANTWTGRCPGIDEPTVPLIAHTWNPPAQYGVRASERLRLILLEPSTTSAMTGQPRWPGGSSGGETVIIEVYGPASLEAFERRMASVQPIIDSLRFGCGPSAGRPCGAP